MSANPILTTQIICAENIESLSNNHLTCSSHNDIIFDTPNLLIRNLRIDKHIRNLIFGESNADTSDQYRVESVAVNKIDLTELGSVELTSVDNLKATTEQSYVQSGENYEEHYLNLIVSDSNYHLNINSSNIYVGNTLFYNYIYDLVNVAILTDSNTGGATVDTSVLNIVTNQEDSSRFDVTSFGEYFTKTLYTTAMTTYNIYIEDLTPPSSSILEPPLILQSRSAVNLNALNVRINGTDLDRLIKQTLNERDLITINITPRSGLSISYTYNDTEWFINRVYGDHFTYDITYKIFDHGESLSNVENSIQLRDVVVNSNINQGVNPNHGGVYGMYSYSNVFDDNLIAGNAYDIYATVVNQITRTVVPNILVAENVFTIPPLEVVSITVMDETRVRITYKDHPIRIPGFSPVISFELSVVKNSRTAPSIEDPNAYNNPSSPNSFPNQNLDLAFSLNEKEYIYNVSDFTDNALYDSTFLINNIDHFFYIKNSLGMVSTYILNWASWQSFFTAPSPAPSNLSITFSTPDQYNFTWIAPTHTGNARYVYYKIYWNGALWSSDHVGFLNIFRTLNMSPIASGSWSIVAYNVYGQEVHSTNFNVTTPILNTTAITSIGFKSFRVTFSATGFNSYYSVSGTHLIPVNSLTTTTGTIDTTPLASGQTYNFSVNLVDRLNKSSNDNNQSITIKTPVLTVTNVANPHMVYTGNPRQFMIYLFYYNYNGASASVSVEGTPTLTDAVYNNRNASGNLSWIYFTFNDRISGGNKTCSANVVDQWGYIASHTKQDLSLTIDFSSVTNNTISQTGTNRTLTHNTSGLTMYQWYRDSGVYVGSSGGSNSIQISNTAGNYYCIVTQTQSYGFTRTVQSTNAIQIVLPSISSGVFTITAQPSSYMFVFTYNGITYTSPSLPSGATISISPSSIFTSAQIYTLHVTLIDSFGFSSTVSVGTFTVILPTIGTLSEKSTSPNSIEVTWTSFGNNGTPSESPSSIQLYYKLKSESTYTVPGIDISGSTDLNGSYLVEGLTLGTAYVFKLIKTYSNYANVESSEIEITTVNAVLPSPPQLDETRISSQVTHNTLAVYWMEGANGSATEIKYTVEYKLTSSSTWITFISNISYGVPQTITSLSSNSSYDIKVTKISKLDGTLLNETHDTFTVSTTLNLPTDISGFRVSSLTYTDIQLTWSSLGGHGDYTLDHVTIYYGNNNPKVQSGTIPITNYNDGTVIPFTIPSGYNIHTYYFKIVKTYVEQSFQKVAEIKCSLKMYPPYVTYHSTNETLTKTSLTHDSIRIRFKYDGPTGYWTNQSEAFSHVELIATYIDVDLTASFSYSSNIVLLSNSFDFNASTNEYSKTVDVLRRSNPWILNLVVYSKSEFSGYTPYKLQAKTLRPQRFEEIYSFTTNRISARVNFLSAYPTSFFVRDYDNVSTSTSVPLTVTSITTTLNNADDSKNVEIVFSNTDVHEFTYYVVYSQVTYQSAQVTYQNEPIFITSISDFTTVPTIAAQTPLWTHLIDSGNSRTVDLIWQQRSNGNDLLQYQILQRIYYTGSVEHVAAEIQLPGDQVTLEWIDDEKYNIIDILQPNSQYFFKINKVLKRGGTLSHVSSVYTMPNIQRKVYFAGINNLGQNGGVTILDAVNPIPYDTPLLIDKDTYASSWYLPNAKIYANTYTGTYYVLNLTSGTLQSTGNNISGFLGDNSATLTRENNSFRPVVDSSNQPINNIIKMCVGSLVIAAIAADNTLYLWGVQQNSKIIYNSTTALTFKYAFPVFNLKYAYVSKLRMSIGESHMVLIYKEGGSVDKIVVRGLYKHVMNSNVENFNYFTHLSSALDSLSQKEFLYPICTAFSTYFYYKGFLYAGGMNQFGQLANNSTDNTNSFDIALCSGFASIQGNIKSVHPTDKGVYVLTNDGELYGIGQLINEPNPSGGYDLNPNILTTMTRSLTNVKKVNSSRFHNDLYVVMMDDTVMFSGTYLDQTTGFINQIGNLFNASSPLYNMANTNLTAVYFN